MILRYHRISHEYIMECDVCRKEFRAKRSHAKTCSDTCRQEYRRHVTLYRRRKP